MEVLFTHLNECGQRLVNQLYNSKQLTIEGSPVLSWDWSRVRIRGTSGSTGSYTKTFGVSQPDFSKRMRIEEDQSRIKMSKVGKAKPPSMRNSSLASPSWDSFMSLSNDMKIWSEKGASSPMKKRSKVERTGESILSTICSSY